MKAIALVAVTLLNSVALFGQNTTGEAKKPNIVFILMDNLGYGELGCYGGGILRGAPTPRIDKLAIEGTRLLNFNVEAQCTPSRSAFITGRFSIRSGIWKVPFGGIRNCGVAIGPGLCHRNLGQMASRQQRSPVRHKSGLR